MIDWSPRDGASGNLTRWMKKAVCEQLRKSPMARRARYSWRVLAMPRLLALGTFTRFVALYGAIDAFALLLEVLFPRLIAPAPGWTAWRSHRPR